MTPADRLAWRTSSYSSNGEACVEVAPTTNGAVVRDTKHRAGGTISFPITAWKAFVTGLTQA
ncbi:DUF397 domain-containing protein [Actinosynnema sp. CS-041913]|uniref:DUF397 domain-containing protein n=1 Tax=Actinosynnema sp. CS-041913 TaxID=3239917 RepID=UPI003D8AC278